MSKVLLTIVLFFISFASNGTCSSNACTGKVSRILAGDAERIYVALDQSTEPLVNAYSPSNSPSGCTPVSRSQSFPGYFTLESSHKRFDEVYSILLASNFSDRELTVRIVSGSSNCLIQYVYTK